MSELRDFTRGLSQSTSKLENPFPYFAEATKAASRLFNAQRDLLLVTGELRARRETKRAAYLAAALVFLNITVTLALFWVTMGLHDAGMSPWVIAALSLLVFGALCGACLFLGLKAGKPPVKLVKAG